jgi:hypothetical protein
MKMRTSNVLSPHFEIGNSYKQSFAMANSPNTSMKELALSIASQVDIISKFLDSQSLPHPSFKPDGPSALPEDDQVQAARISLIEATTNLTLLAQGPAEYIRNESFVVRIVLPP